MKPNELYATWTQYEAMMTNPTLSDEKKVVIGTEWLRALPPKMLCVSSALSYDIVFEAMQGRLHELKETINGSTSRKTKEAESKEEGQKPSPSSKRSSKKSV
jgi:hypothetical protein